MLWLQIPERALLLRALLSQGGTVSGAPISQGVGESDGMRVEMVAEQRRWRRWQQLKVWKTRASINNVRSRFSFSWRASKSDYPIIKREKRANNGKANFVRRIVVCCTVLAKQRSMRPSGRSRNQRRATERRNQMSLPSPQLFLIFNGYGVSTFF